MCHLCGVLCWVAPLRFFFFNDTATTEIYTLSLHDALPIATVRRLLARGAAGIACPESNHPKPFRDRYRLGRFGRGAFARVAIATGTPIVPGAVIGAEGGHPGLRRPRLPGRAPRPPTPPLP